MCILSRISTVNQPERRMILGCYERSRILTNPAQTNDGGHLTQCCRQAAGGYVIRTEERQLCRAANPETGVIRMLHHRADSTPAAVIHG
ncbi:hypothetical protein [Arthrobacter sp. UYCu511]|uniref:hypothetical protein n=1 Tax=Arthrobacter sp. UYCu511 TaxID=3156337 RepID=UPI003392CA35